MFPYIGYCAQTDALHDYLTCRETLMLYARINGMQRAKICDRVELVLKIMTLTVDSDCRVQYLR